MTSVIVAFGMVILNWLAYKSAISVTDVLNNSTTANTINQAAKPPPSPYNVPAYKNDDLWRVLDVLAQQHTVQWIWVKGHAGNVGNERADRLANMGVEQILQGMGQ